MTRCMWMSGRIAALLVVSGLITGAPCPAAASLPQRSSPKPGWYSGETTGGLILKFQLTPRGNNFQVIGSLTAASRTMAIAGTYFGATGRFAASARGNQETSRLRLDETKVDGKYNASTGAFNVTLTFPPSMIERRAEFQCSFAGAKEPTGRAAPPEKLINVWRRSEPPTIASNEPPDYKNNTYSESGATFLINKVDEQGRVITFCNATWTFTGIPTEFRGGQQIAITIQGSVKIGGVEKPGIRQSVWCEVQGLTQGDVEPAIIGYTQGAFKDSDVGSFVYTVPENAPDKILIIVRGDYGLGFIAAFTYKRSQERFAQKIDEPSTVSPRPTAGKPPKRPASGSGSQATTTGGGKVKNSGRRPTTGSATPARPVPSEKPGIIGRMVSMRGDVDISVEADGRYVPITPGMEIPVGAKINTGWKSELVFTRSDGRTFRLGPMSLLYIKEQEVFLKVGELKDQIQRPGGLEKDFEVKTATATASRRGTVYKVEYFEEEKATVISVEQGSVVVKPVNARHKPVTVNAGYRVVVTDEVLGPVHTIPKD